MQGFPHAVSVIAHRGASAYESEHTVAAYDLALALGADRLELDLRALPDGEMVVLHDRTLLRTAGDPRTVSRLRVADLGALPVHRRPLRLDEVFGRYGRHARYWLELKGPAPRDLPPLIAAIGRHGVRANVGVQSFDHGALRLLRAIDPGLPLAALYRPAASPRAVARELPRTAVWAGAIAPCCVRAVLAATGDRAAA